MSFLWCWQTGFFPDTTGLCAGVGCREEEEFSGGER